MSRPSLATPCPAPYSMSGARRLSTVPFGSTAEQDDTADLEYTRAITQEFKNAKPRRRSTFQRRERKDAPVTIFEDVVEDQELVIAESKREIGGSTLLGKAAKKMPRSSIARPQETIVEEPAAQGEVRMKRRASTLADSIPGLRFKMAEPVKEAPQDAKSQGGLKKDPRRRTIFVPTDDTTMLTIHPGANTTDRLNDTFQIANVPQLPRPVCEAPPATKQSPKPAARKPRMSLAVAPKRLPLQQMASEKNNLPAFDVPGQNGGKENLPPRSQVSVGEKKPVSRLYAPTAASHARGSMQARKAVQAPRHLQKNRNTGAHNSAVSRMAASEMKQGRLPPATHRIDSLYRPRASVAAHDSYFSRPSAPNAQKSAAVAQPVPRPTEPTLAPMKRSPPFQRPKSLDSKASNLQHYPVLSRDLAQPDLYEDAWLGHQEVALTELINQILNGASHEADEWHDQNMSLQERLVEIYHQPFVSTLHQRLQASLLYGALSMPKDASPVVVSRDIGLRKRFLNLWLDTYDESLLRHAAEVVVGRQIPQSKVSSAVWSIEGSMDPHHGRRSLINFLETFFVDVHDVAVDVDSEAGRWRKMVSRSLMLVWLLDQAKTSHAVSGCLFKKSCSRKSSTQVLQILAAIALSSSIGDLSRALRSCDYTISAEQDPLDEVTWRIDNMATDMRDGIFLVKLVEMLLNTAGQNTLSQQLKMPCLGHAQKIYNVEIALSALHGRGRLGDVTASAEDIVNGHREKTLSLLWGLASAYGLDYLVDFGELAKDIRKHDKTVGIPDNVQYLAQHQQEELLQTWATVLCAREDVQVTNLTTSFADGRAYAAIVEAFAAFCKTAESSGEGKDGHSTSRPHHLSTTQRSSCAARLRALGCSTAFINSLTSTHQISNWQTTISHLAFLASRLLPLKRQYNAAVTLQRAYRLRRSRIMASQRVKLMRLAHACATVVRTRNQVVDAAVVLQRAWRAVVGARIARLEADVGGFQVWARGWLVRRRVLAGRRGAVERVMGGW